MRVVVARSQHVGAARVGRRPDPVRARAGESLDLAYEIAGGCTPTAKI